MARVFPTTLNTAANFPQIAPYGEHVPPGVQPGDILQELRDGIIALETVVGVTGAAQRTFTRRSMVFNIDNGAGTTRDDVMSFPAAVTIRAARLIYVGDATAGTVAAGNIKIGTALAGAQIVAAAAYTDSAALGTVEDLTIITTAAVNVIAAGGEIFIRHTGVATTAAGEVVVEVDYTYN